MTGNQESPLDIPKLVYRVAWFLPERLRFGRDGHYVPVSRDLAVCTQVNHLWRSTLIPLLWMNFYSVQAWSLKIPLSVVQKHSHHIRYANLGFRFPVPALYSIHFRELDSKLRDPMAIRDLTRSNPQLEHLSAIISLEAVVVSLATILEPLSELKSIKLSGGLHITLDQILQPLSRLSKLSQLTLDMFSDLLPADMSQTQPKSQS